MHKLEINKISEFSARNHHGPKMKSSLSVLVCGLPVAVRTRALLSSTEDVYEADGSRFWALLFLIFLFYTLSLYSVYLPHSSVLLEWQRQSRVFASCIRGGVWNPTLAPGVTFLTTQMSTTISVPSSHKTVMGQKVRTEGRAVTSGQEVDPPAGMLT